MFLCYGLAWSATSESVTTLHLIVKLVCYNFDKNGFKLTTGVRYDQDLSLVVSPSALSLNHSAIRVFSVNSGLLSKVFWMSSCSALIYPLAYLTGFSLVTLFYRNNLNRLFY